MSDLVERLRKAFLAEVSYDILHEAAGEIEKLRLGLSERNRIKTKMIDEIDDLREEVCKLIVENEKYKKWFDDNGANLANHRIGGFKFGEFTEPKQDDDKCFEERMEDALTAEDFNFDLAVEISKEKP